MTTADKTNGPDFCDDAVDTAVNEHEPRFLLELRVSCLSADGRTNTPLGRCDNTGNWIPVEFKAEQTVNETEGVELAQLLTNVDLLGENPFLCIEDAVTCVAQTVQRCVTSD